MSLSLTAMLDGLGASDADLDFLSEPAVDEDGSGSVSVASERTASTNGDDYSDHDNYLEPRGLSTTGTVAGAGEGAAFENNGVHESGDDNNGDGLDDTCSYRSIEYLEPVSGWRSGTLVEMYRGHLTGGDEDRADTIGSVSGTNNNNNDYGDDDMMGAHSHQQNRYEEEIGSFSGTIVSSAASEDVYATPAPPVQVIGGPPSLIDHPGSEFASAFSYAGASAYPTQEQPHGVRMVPQPLSISTTETQYRNLASLDGNLAADGCSLADSSLSFRPSLMETSFIDNVSVLGGETESGNDTLYQTTLQSLPSRTHGSPDGIGGDTPGTHNREAFMNVAAKLQSDSRLKDGKVWFARFSERDWAQFQQEAEMILAALHPDHETPRLALPPEAPPVPFGLRGAAANALTVGANYNAKEFLPSSFVCAVCNDVIVGATTLSCGCPNATICTACWETHSTVSYEGDEEGVIIVEKNHVCPSCNCNITGTTPCHAMDIAVLHCVKALPNGLAIQVAYYQRLRAWREEVLRRGAVPNESRDRLLAELIQREEEMLWKETKQESFRKRDRRWMILGEVALFAIGTIGAIILTSKGGRAFGRRPR